MGVVTSVFLRPWDVVSRVSIHFKRGCQVTIPILCMDESCLRLLPITKEGLPKTLHTPNLFSFASIFEMCYHKAKARR